MKKYKVLRAGFTLLEVALVLLIGGIIMMAGATMLTDYLAESRIMLTQSRMQDIDSAIIQYLNVNGVLPCPAAVNDLQDSAHFGRSITDYATTPGTGCAQASTAPATHKTTATTVPPAPPSSPALNNDPGVVVMGAVPVRTLNLPDQEMADAWGDRFVYEVTDVLTSAGNYDPGQGSISVIDSKDNLKVGPTPTYPKAGYAQYVIVSYGEDRAGAYTISGAQGGVPCPASGPETTNCTPGTSVFRQTMLTSYQKGNSYFDDYVTYHSQINSTGVTVPSGIVSPYVGTTCPPGWGPYNTNTSCVLSTGVICCQKK